MLHFLHFTVGSISKVFFHGPLKALFKSFSKKILNFLLCGEHHAPCQLCTFWKILAYCILSFYFFFFFSFMYFTLSKIHVWNIDLVVCAKLWHFYSCNFHANSLGILNRLKNTLIFCPWDIQCIVTPKWTFRLVLAHSEWSSWSSHQSNK